MKILITMAPLIISMVIAALVFTAPAFREQAYRVFNDFAVKSGIQLYMTQMSAAEARIIDPVLSTVARGYTNAELVGNALFPVVPVGQRGGQVISFGKEAFRQYRTARSPGTDTARVQFGYTAGRFTLEQHALDGVLPFELQEEADAQVGVDLGAGTVVAVQDIINLRVEVQQAALARNPANYGVNNKATLSGTDLWTNEASNPSKQIRDAGTSIRSQTGRRPTVALLSAKAFAAVQEHPLILDRTKYTSKDSITPQILAALWNLQSVVIGDAIQELVDGTLTDVWGGDVILAFSQTAGVNNRGLPSYGYTYRLTNYPVAEQPWYDKKAKSWIYPVTDELQPQLVGADGGFLIQNAVAG